MSKFKILSFYAFTNVNDIGQKLNCGAYLDQLRRVSVGQYNVENAQSINDILDSL